MKNNRKKNILVIGGCGYIGSHMVKFLCDNDHSVTVLDNLSNGYKDSLVGGKLIIGDFSDTNLITKLLSTTAFDGIIHFASFIQVAESVIDPSKYYLNNLIKTISLLDVIKAHNNIPFVFSSTAAVYGMPSCNPIVESQVLNPINPYGKSKLYVENILKDYDAAYGLKSVSLRYFNAAGADPLSRIGERHQPETHLIPLAIHSALGVRPALNIYGVDYETKDGTCIRDYIHVEDLVCAHFDALMYLENGGKSASFNLGAGVGYSVYEIIEMISKVTGLEVPYQTMSRRPGDPDVLVASIELAKTTLNFTPRHSSLNQIITDAYNWEIRRTSFNDN
jgi:UDP-glucose 4-epimerase